MTRRRGPPPEGWGPIGYRDRLAEGWAAFLEPVTAAAAPWLRVVEARGIDAVRATYLRLLDGTADPGEGHFVML